MNTLQNTHKADVRETGYPLQDMECRILGC